MHAAVITVFPTLFEPFARVGIVGRAVERGLLELSTVNPRDFSEDRHRRVDDRPYGGGPGMVMLVQPLKAAIEAAEQGMGGRALRLYLSPQGQRLDHEKLLQLAQQPRIVLLCGRYEGVDERLIESMIDEELSVGDYVLSGGEVPAMVVLDGLIRLIPGALGHEDSAEQDSFATGLLDCPHFSRPEVIEGLKVPPVLLSGNHDDVRRWRLKQSLGRTWLRRPDVLTATELDSEQTGLLAEFQAEWRAQHGAAGLDQTDGKKGK